MNLKRNIYIIIISIIIYFVLTICYEKIIKKDEFMYIYSLTKTVSRGDKLLESDFTKIKISADESDKYVTTVDEDSYYKEDYKEGYIMLKDMILTENEYIKTSENTEIVSIKLDSSTDAGSYQIEKGSIVNIYYSAKISEVENIFNKLNKESIISSNLENSFVTIKFLEEIKILNCFDKNGDKINKDNIIETILIGVSKEDSIKISNLKNYGKFSISILR